VLWDFEGVATATGFTVKGDSQGVRVSGLVKGDPLFDIGNASDQSHELTTGVRLNLKRIDGKPIRVRVLRGDLPVAEPGSGPYQYVFPWSWLPFCHLVTAYFWRCDDCRSPATLRRFVSNP
jgi:hypothetical protein